jgi:hypothetical protein
MIFIGFASTEHAHHIWLYTWIFPCLKYCTHTMNMYRCIASWPTHDTPCYTHPAYLCLLITCFPIFQKFHLSGAMPHTPCTPFPAYDLYPLRFPLFILPFRRHACLVILVCRLAANQTSGTKNRPRGARAMRAAHRACRKITHLICVIWCAALSLSCIAL